ncbi:protein tolkin-like [Microplitis mediator]|uniref:protein tolkin-like n=1 Tax=Microplitis mediator TaxID=375433 RepID=UPI0025562A52|nr:protein tolkin-like [Microplitis mediator]
MLYIFFITLKVIVLASFFSSYETVVTASNIRVKRSLAVLDKDQLWDDGIIPYEIDNTLSGSHRRLLKLAMEEWEQSTCIQFVDRDNETFLHYLLVSRSGFGCESYVGRTLSGRNDLNLGGGCMSYRILLHELGHIIGFYHEHNRPDRDEHVIINMDNVKTGNNYNFDKLSSEETNTLNQKYDYYSIMHYRRNEFSIDKFKDTITPIESANNEIDIIGKKARLSDTDVTATNLLYECPECGETLRYSNGTFGSSNNSLIIGEYCQWRITAAHGEKIALVITSLSVPRKSNCPSDYLEIIDGYSLRSPVLARLCGKGKVLQPLISTSNHMLVEYKRKTFNKKNYGFTANYYKICGGDININDEDKYYYLESPNYPHKYEANKKCIWHINAPRNRKISVVFDYFKLENSVDCKNDFLEIRDGNGDDYSSPLIGIYCHKNSPRKVLSTDNKLFIKFVSNDEIEKNGFSAIINVKH